MAHPVSPSKDGPSTIPMNDGQITMPAVVMRRPKRQRLSKACDACHKIKRRCDGKNPCDNCFHASKECRYTDATGRSIAPPSTAVSVRDKSSGSSNNAQMIVSGSSSSGPSIPQVQVRPAPQSHVTSPTTFLAGESSGVQSNPRKRFRSVDDPDGLPTILSLPSVRPVLPPDFVNSQLLVLRRDLINIFFANCHPHTLIIHAPSFTSDLRLDRIPLYLVDAMCALAAPFCQNPELRTSPPQYIGRPFAETALTLMFDGNGQLVAPLCLATVQALCLLQSYVLVARRSVDITLTYYDHALRMLKDLDILSPSTNSVASPSQPKNGIVETECLRRIYWTMQLVKFISTVISDKPRSLHREFVVCLPCSESAFQFSAHSDSPEYLNIPSDMRCVSEYGHVIRVSRILSEIHTHKFHNEAGDLRLLNECETRLQAWHETLADALTLSEENIAHRLSMWETSSNTSAWCFFFIHILHACCILLLDNGPHHQEALDIIARIITSLGPRARNSMLMTIVLKVRSLAMEAHKSNPMPSTKASLKQWNSLMKQNRPGIDPLCKSWVKIYEALWASVHMVPGSSRRLIGDASTHQSHTSTPSNSSLSDASHTTLHSGRHSSQTQSTIVEIIPEPSDSATASSRSRQPPTVQDQAGSHLWGDRALIERELQGKMPPLREVHGILKRLPPLKSLGLLETRLEESAPESSIIESSHSVPSDAFSDFSSDSRNISTHRSRETSTFAVIGGHHAEATAYVDYHRTSVHLRTPRSFHNTSPRQLLNPQLPHTFDRHTAVRMTLPSGESI